VVRSAARDRGSALCPGTSRARGIAATGSTEAGRECAAGRAICVVLDAGAYTHTSIALHAAIKGANVPVIELHISNVHAREPFRRRSRLSAAARGITVGFDVQSPALAIAGFKLLEEKGCKT
jgi:3-dehydroquinate dehydratase-2